MFFAFPKFKPYSVRHPIVNTGIPVSIKSSRQSEPNGPVKTVCSFLLPISPTVTHFHPSGKACGSPSPSSGEEAGGKVPLARRLEHGGLVALHARPHPLQRRSRPPPGRSAAPRAGPRSAPAPAAEAGEKDKIGYNTLADIWLRYHLTLSIISSRLEKLSPIKHIFAL